jgi:hypothetical protein
MNRRKDQGCQVITGERSGRPVINRRKDQGGLLITGEVSGYKLLSEGKIRDISR